MNYSWFRDLGHLAKTGNFSQAAQLSNVSQPTLSRRVQAIEAWMGVCLVDRAKQPVRLTPAGSQILEAGQQALARLETERSQIREAQSLPDKYVVTFGTQHSIGWRFYPSWLKSFEDAYGPIISRLRADDLPNCMLDLKNGDVDFVIAYHSAGTGIGAGDQGSKVGDIAENSIVIGKDRLIPVCKPRSDGEPLFSFDASIHELPFLRFGDEAPIGRHIEPLLKSKNLNARLRTVYENSMAGALRIRARDGAGLAWLPRSLVEPDLVYGILVRTGDSEWEVDLEIRLHRNKEHANHLTRSIWSFLAVRESIPLTEVAR
ncbi:MAG: LysR substrate-binding domain-containing protein [Albidovulum sp.]|nr:LysR substrate-binding domain-containing protein [Albidovulum sp.]